jgi:hypothetical protein
VDEALCNVIRHGYENAQERTDLDQPVALGFGQWDPPGIKIVLEDEAKQVDPSVIKSRDLDEIRPAAWACTSSSR